MSSCMGAAVIMCSPVSRVRQLQLLWSGAPLSTRPTGSSSYQAWESGTDTQAVGPTVQAYDKYHQLHGAGCPRTDAASEPVTGPC